LVTPEGIFLEVYEIFYDVYVQTGPDLLSGPCQMNTKSKADWNWNLSLSSM